MFDVTISLLTPPPKKKIASKFGTFDKNERSRVR